MLIPCKKSDAPSEIRVALTLIFRTALGNLAYDSTIRVITLMAQIYVYVFDFLKTTSENKLFISLMHNRRKGARRTESANFGKPTT